VFPDWLAVTVQVPTPVIDRMEPEIEQDPAALNVTVNPELAEADKVMGETPYITEAGLDASVIVCEALVIVTCPAT